MSFKRMQNVGGSLAILTILVSAAWGQDEAVKSPIQVVDSETVSGTRSLVDANGYFTPTQGSAWAQPNVTEVDLQEPVEAGQVDFNTPPVAGAESFMKLRFGFDALFWERGRPEDTVFATEDNGQQWSFGDFDLAEGDVRYIIQYMTDDNTGYELKFFDIDAFSSTIQASGTRIRPLFFQALPANLSNNFEFTYESRLKSIEINSWVSESDTRRSAYGVRHLNLDETFNVVGGFNNGLFSRTDNDLWGLTRSWERRRELLNRLTMVGGLNLGLYLNRTKINVDTLNVDDDSDDENIAGHLGFNIGLRYRASSNVTFRLGYEGLALFGVALASTQSIEQQILNGLDDPELSSLYFGGLNLGAVATF